MVTCWEMADFLALVKFVMSNSVLSCHFPIGILGQVWCLIVSIPDLCPLSYFMHMRQVSISDSSQQAHDVETTSCQRRCDVASTLIRRCFDDVVFRLCSCCDFNYTNLHPVGRILVELIEPLCTILICQSYV